MLEQGAAALDTKKAVSGKLTGAKALDTFKAQAGARSRASQKAMLSPAAPLAARKSPATTGGPGTETGQASNETTSAAKGVTAGPLSLEGLSDEEWDIVEAIKAIGDWLWGIIAGDFNEEMDIVQTIIRALLTMIPVVDQIADVQDLVAALYKLVWQGRYTEVEPWVGLVLTLIGLVPTVGSAVKGIGKLIWKSLKNSGGIGSMLARMGGGVVDTIGKFLKNADSHLAFVKGEATKLFSQARGWVSDTIGQIKGLLSNSYLVNSTTEWLFGVKSRLESVRDKLVRFKNTLAKASAQAPAKIAEMFTKLVGGLRGTVRVVNAIGYRRFCDLVEDVPILKLEQFVKELGAKEMQKVADKYGGKAMNKYGPSFFKNFKGVTEATKKHLIDGKGVVRSKKQVDGCHDEAMFYKRHIAPADVEKVKIISRQPMGQGMYKYKYKLYKKSPKGTGLTDEPVSRMVEKTTISGLAGDWNKWSKIFEDAAAQGIKNCTLNSNGAGKFTANIKGVMYEGWVRNNEIHSIYPLL